MSCIIIVASQVYRLRVPLHQIAASLSDDPLLLQTLYHTVPTGAYSRTFLRYLLTHRLDLTYSFPTNTAVENTQLSSCNHLTTEQVSTDSVLGHTADQVGASVAGVSKRGSNTVFTGAVNDVGKEAAATAAATADAFCGRDCVSPGYWRAPLAGEQLSLCWLSCNRGRYRGPGKKIANKLANTCTCHRRCPIMAHISY